MGKSSGQRFSVRGTPKGVRVAGAGVLWELESLGATDIRIEYLDAVGRPTGPRTSFDRTTDPHEAAERFHPDRREIARVRFMSGGKPRSLLYVQHDAMSKGPLPQVLTRFFAGGVDAIIQKGAMSVASSAGYQKLLGSAKRHLDRDHDVLVTDTPSQAGFLTRRPGTLHCYEYGGRFGYDTDEQHAGHHARRRSGPLPLHAAQARSFTSRPPRRPAVTARRVTACFSASVRASTEELSGVVHPPTGARGADRPAAGRGDPGCQLAGAHPTAAPTRVRFGNAAITTSMNACTRGERWRRVG